MPKRPYKLLLVEDSVVDAELIVHELSKGERLPDAHRVDTLDALRAALERPWDVVIADDRLPGFNATQTLEFVLGAQPDTPVIIVSGALDEETAVTHLRAGARDFVTKQRLSRLNAAVARELDSSQVAKAKRAAERTAEQLAAIVASSADAIYAKSLNGELTSWNAAAERLFGYTASEVVGGENPTIPAGYQARHDALCARVSAGEVVPAYETVRLRKDGTAVAVQVSVSVIAGADGEVVGLATNARDVSEYRSVLENVAEGVVTFDEKGVIESFNRAAVGLFGYSEEEAIGQLFSSLVGAADSSDVFSAAWLERTALPPRHDSSSDLVGRRKDGSAFPINLAVSDVQHGARRLHIGCIRDISVGRAHAEELQRLAVHDVLTGLPNRVLFADRVNQAIASATRNADPLALLVMDLNGFKEVNDASGHDRGDVLLQQVAERLTGCLRDTDTVARLGGDEFGVLPAGVTDVAGAVAVAWKLQEALKPAFFVDGREIAVQASIGIALFPEHGDNLFDLLRRSDLAMYDAKRSGSGYALFVADQEQASVRRFGLLADLRRCIERDELVLHYQPKIDLASRKAVGVEALIRWNHPSGTLFMPGEFMHEVERNELMVPITQWVIRDALQRLRTWREQGYDLTMAVNLGARCLAEGTGIFETTEQLMQNLAIPPGQLTFELTESTLIDTAVPGLLARLEDLAEPLSIDDFGTGHSSLRYLQRLPVVEVKADRSFVASMCSVSGDAVIVRSIIDLAHNLSLKVVAEGVEDEETLDLLVEYGCDEAQGYYFSRPMPGEEVVQWLETSAFGASKTLSPIGLVSTNGRPTATGDHETERPDAHLHRGAERILVVEDDAAVRTLTRHLLVNKGYNVVTAANGEEALAIYRDRPVDLVLTDIVMPKLSGTNLAAELRRSSPGLPVVFMSGYPHETGRDTIANADAFIQKPFADRDLGKTIRATLDSKPASALRAGRPQVRV